MGAAGQRAGRLDAVHLRHADVEEDDVGFQRLHHRHRFAAVGGFTDDHELRPRFLEALDDLHAHQAFIVGNDGGRGGGGNEACMRTLVHQVVGGATS